MSRSYSQHTSRMPLEPSTMTSRLSPAVGAISPMRFTPCLTFSLIHSEPDRVLPAPRPAKNIQTCQGCGGGNCSGLANDFHVLSAFAIFAGFSFDKFEMISSSLDCGTSSMDDTCQCFKRSVELMLVVNLYMASELQRREFGPHLGVEFDAIRDGVAARTPIFHLASS